jgi:carbon storage regulator
MRVVTRKLNESIAIGNDIKVSVLDIGKNQVKLGIEAPMETPVTRVEILEALIRENYDAAKVPEDFNDLVEDIKS